MSKQASLSDEDGVPHVDYRIQVNFNKCSSTLTTFISTRCSFSIGNHKTSQVFTVIAKKWRCFDPSDWAHPFYQQHSTGLYLIYYKIRFIWFIWFIIDDRILIVSNRLTHWYAWRKSRCTFIRDGLGFCLTWSYVLFFFFSCQIPELHMTFYGWLNGVEMQFFLNFKIFFKKLFSFPKKKKKRLHQIKWNSKLWIGNSIVDRMQFNTLYV